MGYGAHNQLPHKLRQRLDAVAEAETRLRQKVSTAQACRGVAGVGMLVNGRLWEGRYLRASDAEFLGIVDFAAGTYAGRLRNQPVHVAAAAKLQLKNRVPWLAFGEAALGQRRWLLNWPPEDDGYGTRRDVLHPDREPRETVVLTRLMADMSATAGAVNPAYRKVAGSQQLSDPDGFLPRILLGFPSNRGIWGIFWGATGDSSVDLLCPHCCHPTVVDDDSQSFIGTCQMCGEEVESWMADYTQRNYSAGFISRMAQDWRQGLPIRIPCSCTYRGEKVVDYKQPSANVMQLSHHQFVSAAGVWFTVTLPSGVMVSNETEFVAGDVFAWPAKTMKIPPAEFAVSIMSQLHAMQRVAGDEFTVLAAAWFAGQAIWPTWDRSHIYFPAELFPSGKLPDIEADNIVLDMTPAILAGCRWEEEHGFRVDAFLFPPVKVGDAKLFELPSPSSARPGLPATIQVDWRIGGSSRAHSSRVCYADSPERVAVEAVMKKECEEAKSEIAAHCSGSM